MQKQCMHTHCNPSVALKLKVPEIPQVKDKNKINQVNSKQTQVVSVVHDIICELYLHSISLLNILYRIQTVHTLTKTDSLN